MAEEAVWRGGVELKRGRFVGVERERERVSSSSGSELLCKINI